MYPDGIRRLLPWFEVINPEGKAMAQTMIKCLKFPPLNFESWSCAHESQNVQMKSLLRLLKV